MQARAEAAGSLLQVESARGAGTIITVTIPA
jgi:signal transduction histidine kinase